MSEQSTIKWNRKFHSKPMQLDPPEQALEEFLLLDPLQPILDFACGDGRHSIPMAQKGFEVIAMDGSPVGLHRLNQFASIFGLEISCWLQDADDLPVKATHKFGSVWISHFLPTQNQLNWLYAQLPQEGVLCLLTFNLQQSNFNPSFCLQPAQFIDLYPRRKLVLYESRIDKDHHHDFYVWRK